MNAEQWVICLVFGSVLTLPLQSQERQYLTDQAEQILDQDEQASLPEEFLEQQQELSLHPLNLNTATLQMLEASCLFTPYQARVILAYRERYGKLLSIYELASLPGFRLSRLKEIAPCITAEHDPRGVVTNQPGNRAMFYAGRRFPVSSGYRPGGQEDTSPAYGGSPLETSLRIRYTAGSHTTLGMAYEKDAGEQILRGRVPEYLTGYVRYRGHGILEQLLLGSYRLHQGMGLVHGSCFINSVEGIMASPPVLLSLKPYAGTCESAVNRGIACRLDFSPVKVTFWSSYQPMDMSAAHIPLEADRLEWTLYRRETGLHRTAGEVNGTGLGYLGHTGIAVTVTHRHLRAGGQFTTGLTGLTRKGQDSLGVTGQPVSFSSTSLYWDWQWGRIGSFGEYSIQRLENSAILAGIRVQCSPFLSGGLLVHYYGTSYRETLASAYSSGSHVSNEEGLAIYLRAEPGRNMVASLAVELFYYPAPRYSCLVPSSGYQLRAELTGTGSGPWRWKLLYRLKIMQQTPSASRIGINDLLSVRQEKLEGRMAYLIGDSFRWQSRLILSAGRLHPRDFGYAAVQNLKFCPLKSAACRIQFVVFNVSRWEDRIYIHEPGLYLHYGFPVYYGRGQKITVAASVKAGDRITLEGLGSMVRYHDRDRIGSGNELVEGAVRYTAGVQLRLRL